ncbi:hypothetical protein YK56LOC_31760 [Caballeronia sp. HLA56]
MARITVKRYQTLISKGGLDALRQLQAGGRISALDQKALQWIVAAVNGSAVSYGFDSDSWTNARVRELIANEFGVRYSRVYIWQLTHDLGLGYQLVRK